MAIFKCKICGGSLDVTPEMTAGTCQYCGTTMTLPRIGDDRRANLYARANDYRRANDYDRAMSVYETILAEDPSDAEASWSLVLCKYGVEYVEDPKTRKRIPTCNRTQTLSIFDDGDYRQALVHASGEARTLYEDEAAVIDGIRKGILEISNREEPFDVFICYRETDDRSRRTPDSVIAQELYDKLVKQGYKVFFSRITLEDKLGEAYEPYIYAALRSARVMVVVGTKAEYFDSVWVKNEWSRYLSLIRGGAEKTLIPAYRDMDPKDLPAPLSSLQAQNMGNLGYMQDLVRGIEKIIPKAAPVSRRRGAKGKAVDEATETGGTETGGHPSESRTETALRIDETTQTVTGISGSPGATLVIPSEIKAIAPGAFADFAGIVSVTIEPGNLRSIPKRAFAGCRDIESLAIPQTLVSIGDEAFSGCAKLSDIHYSWVTVRGKIHTHTDTACLKSVGARAFAGCDGLGRMDFPDSFTSLGNEAFADCRSLEQVYFDSLKTMGERAFAGCVKLADVYFSGEKAAVSISRGAFAGCVSLKEISFYYGSKKWNIDEEAFAGCTSIAKLDFEEGLRKIRKNAFAGCTGLNNIVFNDEFCVEVEAGAFARCSALQSISVGAAAIAPDAFEGCGRVKNINFASNSPLKSLRWLAPFFESGTPPRLGGIQEVWRIDEGAFEGCDFLLSTLKLPPKGVVDIGKNAFAGLALKEVVIPADVQTIGEGAFARCTSLESVVFRDNKLQAIGNGAFAGCVALKKFTFKDGYSELQAIGSKAFEGCTALTEFIVPPYVTSIEKDAFEGCNNLKLVYLQDQTAKLYRKKKIVIDHPAVSANREQFLRITGAKKTKISIPKNINTIEEGAFRHHSGVKSLTIPPNIELIEENAFEGCTGLERLVIPGSVSSIGKNAFKDCSGLASISLSPNINNIDEGTFAGCTALKRLIIPAGVKSIRSRAFAGCAGLEEIIFPSNGVEVYGEAFAGCTGLKNLVLPKDIRLDEKAFDGCTGLQTVVVPGTVRIHPNAFAGCTAISTASRRRLWNLRYRRGAAISCFGILFVLLSSFFAFSGMRSGEAIVNLMNILSGETSLSGLFGIEGVILLVVLLMLTCIVIALPELFKGGCAIVLIVLYFPVSLSVSIIAGIEHGYSAAGFIILIAGVILLPVVCIVRFNKREKRLDKYVMPVKNLIGEIINVSSAASPPKPALIIYRKIKDIEKTIPLVRQKMTKNDARFLNFYDRYCALYLEMRFRLYMSLMRDVLIAKGEIDRTDVRHFIYAVKDDIEQMKRLLALKTEGLISQVFDKLMQNPDVKQIRKTKLESLEYEFVLDDDDDRKTKKIKSGLTLPKTGSAMTSIMRKIAEAETYLLSIQSGGDASVHAPENDMDTVVEQYRKLNDEYAELVAERRSKT